MVNKIDTERRSELAKGTSAALDSVKANCSSNSQSCEPPHEVIGQQRRPPSTTTICIGVQRNNSLFSVNKCFFIFNFIVVFALMGLKGCEATTCETAGPARGGIDRGHK